jgi:phosphatidylethanolamine-binding protein (PEBP) family uncharacterized protein
MAVGFENISLVLFVIGGACPPSGHGMHRYVFTVWALPVEKLDLPDGATAANAGFMLNAMALATAKITATYVTP